MSFSIFTSFVNVDNFFAAVGINTLSLDRETLYVGLPIHLSNTGNSREISVI